MKQWLTLAGTKVHTFLKSSSNTLIARNKIKMEGYQIVAQSLANNGIKYMFGVVGKCLTPHWNLQITIKSSHNARNIFLASMSLTECTQKK